MVSPSDALAFCLEIPLVIVLLVATQPTIDRWAKAAARRAVESRAVALYIDLLVWLMERGWIKPPAMTRAPIRPEPSLPASGVPVVVKPALASLFNDESADPDEGRARLENLRVVSNRAADVLRELISAMPSKSHGTRIEFRSGPSRRTICLVSWSEEPIANGKTVH